MQFKCLLKASLRDSHHSRLSDSSLLFVRFEVYVYYYYYYYDNTRERKKKDRVPRRRSTGFGVGNEGVVTTVDCMWRDYRAR